MKFLFIADDASNLRKQTFTNNYEITFAPATDILDKVSILRDIQNLEIEKLFEIYSFFKKEFGIHTTPVRISSNLAEILNLLSREDLNMPEEINLNTYDIDKKITHNDLGVIGKPIIKESVGYLGTLDRIYKEFNKQGKNKTLSVFSKLSNFYVEELLEANSSVRRFFNIISRTMDYIKSCANHEPISDEELEMCVRIIVVDAFIRCKIFENPGGYSYVTSI